jgi:hypothetical protein
MEKAIMVRRITNEWERELRFFPLERVLPTGQALSVNTTYLIASLVSTNTVNGNPILRQQVLTETDMRLLLLLLESPQYCPQEVLRASLYASYSGLLEGLFSSEPAAKAQWQATITEQRLLLQRAQELGTWKKELKPLYNALSKLRPKLHPFGLEVALFASCSAYVLMPLPRPRHQRRSNSHSPLLVTEASA